MGKLVSLAFLLLTPCSRLPSRLRPPPVWPWVWVCVLTGPPLVPVTSPLPQLLAPVPVLVCVWGWCRRWVGPWATRSGGDGSSPERGRSINQSPINHTNMENETSRAGGKNGVLKRSALLCSIGWCRTLTNAKAASRKARVMPATTAKHCHTDSDRR